MVKTSMTLMGKIFMALFFFASGVAVGFFYDKGEASPNSGNQLNVTVEGKVKKGSEVNINLEDVDQSAEEENTKKKWFNK